MHNLHISLKQGGAVLCIILLLLLLLQLLQHNILAGVTMPLVREGSFFAGQPYKLP